MDIKSIKRTYVRYFLACIIACGLLDASLQAEGGHHKGGTRNQGAQRRKQDGDRGEGRGKKQGKKGHRGGKGKKNNGEQRHKSKKVHDDNGQSGSEERGEKTYVGGPIAAGATGVAVGAPVSPVEVGQVTIEGQPESAEPTMQQTVVEEGSAE